MATRKRKPLRRVTPRAAKWYRESVAKGRRLGRETDEAAWRRKQLKKLRDDVSLLRQHYKGFEARDGYSMQPGKLARLTPGRLNKLKLLARETHRELSQPYVVKRARSKKSKAALYKHTRAVKVKGRKTFLVHVPKPETTQVEVVGTKRKRVREVRKVKGGRVEEQFFYFADYAKRAPKTMAQILRITERMLKDMPRGQYVMLSSTYGHIGTGMDRRLLLQAIETDWLGYDAAPDPRAGRKESRGLAATLIGYKLVATTADGSRREYEERLTRRMRVDRYVKQVRESAATRRRKRLRGR